MFFNEVLQHDRISWINFDIDTSGKLKLMKFSKKLRMIQNLQAEISETMAYWLHLFKKKFLWLCIFTKCLNPVWKLRLDSLF